MCTYSGTGINLKQEGKPLEYLQTVDHIMRHKEQLLDIGESASKQYSIEMSVKDMGKDWESMLLALKPHPSGSYILLGDTVEEVFRTTYPPFPITP